MGNGIIQEEPKNEEASDQEDNEVQAFVKQGVVQMQREG